MSKIIIFIANMKDHILVEGLLLELTYYGKLKVSDDEQESKQYVYNLIIFTILVFLTLFQSNERFSTLPFSFSFVIIFLIGNIVVKIFKAFYERKNSLYLTTASITICNHKDEVLQKWMLANVYQFSQRTYETDDGKVNHLIIAYKDKDAFIDLEKLDEKQILKLFEKLEILNFEIPVINR